MNANSKTSSHKNNQPHLRRSVLATASVLALGGFLATGAMAQTTTYTATVPGGVQTLATGAPASYTDWIKSQQDQSGALSSVINSTSVPSTVLIGVTYTPSTPPTALTNPVNVDDNFVKAITTGNLESGALLEYSTDGTTWTSTFAAIEGNNTVMARQTDVAGNVSSTVSLDFTLDTSKAVSVLTLDDVTSANTINLSESGGRDIQFLTKVFFQ